MLNWLYNWVARRSELYQKTKDEHQIEVKRREIIEESNRTLSEENYKVVDKNSQLKRFLEEAESSLEIETRKGDFLEERVDELIRAIQSLRENAISKDFLEILLQRAKAPLLYAPNKGNISYNLLSVILLKDPKGKKIGDLDLKGWSSVPVKDTEDNEIGRVYSHSNEKTLLEVVHGLYTTILEEKEARRLIKRILPNTQDYS